MTTISKEARRMLFLYGFKLNNKTATKVAKDVNVAFGEGTTTDRAVQDWFKKFRVGDFDVDDKSRSGRQRKIDENEFKAAVEEDPRQSLRELGDRFGISTSNASVYMRRIGKVHKLEKWVPHALTEAQEVNRMSLCISHLLRLRNVDFLDRIVICDEKRMLYDNRKRDREWIDKGSEPDTIPKKDLFPKKLMLTVWWNCSGIIHYSFLNNNETINGEK
ncbi:hypothetical protein G6F61_012794 [Rhizopus arrhizus]|nr:hypothetical protein G6F61_012794 [Rhizopus arrhizus]